MVHFDNFPLITQKRFDDILFRKSFELIKEKQHLSEQGLEKFVSTKPSMNLGLSDKLKTAFLMS